MTRLLFQDSFKHITGKLFKFEIKFETLEITLSFGNKQQNI